MKKVLLFILTFALILLTSCDTTNIELENHDYKLSYNDEYHYDYCDCGHKIHEEKHNIKSETIKEITCKEPGKIRIYCDCGYERIVDVEKNTHTFNEWEIIKEPTCITLGQASRTCDVCGFKEYKDVNYSNHKPQEYKSLEADCTHEGHIGGSYCEICHEELETQTKIEKAPHQFGEWEITTNPTCTYVGQQKRVCDICGLEEYQELPKINHTPVSYDNLDADCTHEGHMGGTYCKECHEELSSKTIIEKTSHTFGEWETMITPTCTNVGEAKRECINCGFTEYKELDKLPHEIVPYEEVDSTCTKEGHTGGTYCKNCNQKITDQTILSVKEHNYSDFEILIEPSCTNLGQEKRVCNDCGHEDYRLIPLKDHEPIPGEVKSSTCIEHGHTEGVYCANCHKELEAPEELPLASHNYLVETITKEPTFLTTGTKEYSCTVCLESITETIPAKKFTQSNWNNLLRLTDFSEYIIRFDLYDFKRNSIQSIKMQKDPVSSNKYIEIKDVRANKTTKYYESGNDLYVSWLDGYKHVTITESMFENFRLLATKAIRRPAYNYDKLLISEGKKASLYYNDVMSTNLYDEEELALVEIRIVADGSLINYNYESDNYSIIIYKVKPTTTTINLPEAKYHDIENGKCKTCNKVFDTYEAEKNNVKFIYAYDKELNQLEFNYKVLDDQADPYFIYHNYYESEDKELIRFTSRYYTMSRKIYNPEFEDYLYDETTGILEIHYKEMPSAKYFLKDDLTMVIYDSNLIIDNPYKGIVEGKTFSMSYKGKYYELNIYSETSLYFAISNEINLYVINGKTIIDYEGMDLENKIINQTFQTDSGIQYDGTISPIYFTLNKDLSLDIYYNNLDESSKKFIGAEFISIEGDIDNFTITFKYNDKTNKIHYTGIIEIL